MGSSETKPEKPIIDENYVINIVSANNRQAQHAEEHAKNSYEIASSLNILMWIAIAIVAGLVVYKLYRIITSYERLRSQVTKNKQETLNQVLSSGN